MMTAATTTPTVSPLEMAPESQRLIAVSLGKIACSRGQKGGINLHRNLLVATVLHKARTAYMLQHFRQRALANNAANAATATDNTTVTATTTTTATDQPTSTTALTATPTTTANVEMREVSDSSSSSSSDNVSPSPSASVTTAAAAPSSTPTPTTISAPSPTFSAATSHPCALGAPSAECGSDQHGGRQVCVGDDKENTPPPSSSSSSPAPCSDVSVCDKRGLAVSSPLPPSPSCEKRFDADRRGSGEGGRDPHNPHNALSSVRCVTQRGGARDVSSSSSGGVGCHGLLKRRRALDWNHESVTAPKVRIVTARCAAAVAVLPSPPSEDSNSPVQAVQCDSPQISSLVNIFSASFSGFSAANLSSSSSSSSDSGNALNGLATCAKEMQIGLDSCRHGHLVMSV